jgi:hypothetical protein
VLPQVCRNFGAEASRAKVVIEHCDIDVVEGLSGLLDCGSWNAVIAVLAQNGGPKMKICRFIIEQEDTDIWRGFGHTHTATGWSDGH